MSKVNPMCRVCKIVLDSENWYRSLKKNGQYLCNGCASKQVRAWREANPERVIAQNTRANRKRGYHPFNENKKCGLFLGVHVAERVLSHVFKNVKRMPILNPGYDFICNRGKKIDVKSSCLHKDGRWKFKINYNIITDYFLCLAFDSREYLNPLHAWLIPGNAVNHLGGASIQPSTIHKWDEYKLDILKVSACCDALR